MKILFSMYTKNVKNERNCRRKIDAFKRKNEKNL